MGKSGLGSKTNHVFQEDFGNILKAYQKKLKKSEILFYYDVAVINPRLFNSRH